MSGHTATPWAVDPDHRPGMGWNAHVVEAADPDNRVCFMTSGPEGKINAAFIVTACNSHADLVKALEVAQDALDGWLAFAEEELGEFDLEECNFNQTETLCHKCESAGCINLKIRNTRAALATLTARKVG